MLPKRLMDLSNWGSGPLDEKTLAKVAKIVDDNRGQTLLSIGTVEIPPDED
jgi:hypothetical protein